MGRKESNQTKTQTVYFAEACENALFAFWQTPYYVWSVRSLNSRWNQILYCLKILSSNLLANLQFAVACTFAIWAYSVPLWTKLNLVVERILQITNADLGIIQGIRWHEISCDRQRFGSSLIRAFVLVANTTTGPDSKLHLALHLIAIPCSKLAYLE